MKQLFGWLRQLAFNPPLEWEDGETEQVSRKVIWRMKPSWLRNLGTRELSCGCRRRIRMVTYRWGCSKHLGQFSGR